MADNDYIIDRNDLILITGSNGFIGSRLVEILLKYGFKNLRCFVRSLVDVDFLDKLIAHSKDANVEIIRGDLLSPDACKRATEKTQLIYHLAAGIREKTADAVYSNTVLATKNLLNALLNNSSLKRFVNVSSFTVYSTEKLRPGTLLDETCDMEKKPEMRGEAYCLAKVKQDELVMDYGRKHGLPYVMVRPGVVYGPGNAEVTGRVGIQKFGIFFHLGGKNRIPVTYVDNCAEAIALAGLRKQIEKEIFNIVDDELPTSQEFLELYKKRVKHLTSIYLPKRLSYWLCFLWELLSIWSGGRIRPTLNRGRWSADWKGNEYSNRKAKRLLGWEPKVSLQVGLQRYFDYCKKAGS